MLKLKKNIINFLKVNIKPICLERTIRGIEADASLNGCANHWRIVESQSIHGVRIDFDLSKDCFEEVEELKPNVWYTKDKFDGNPKDYWLVEIGNCNTGHIFKGEGKNKYLGEATIHFMYIEPLEVEDEGL